MHLFIHLILLYPTPRRMSVKDGYIATLYTLFGWRCHVAMSSSPFLLLIFAPSDGTYDFGWIIAFQRLFVYFILALIRHEKSTNNY